jgi:glutamine amidotransferase
MIRRMIGILDFGMCNLRSVWSAVHELGFDPEYIKKSDLDPARYSHLIIPGVGAFDRAMASIHERGLYNFVQDFHKSGKPILGICLGMQLLADAGEEGQGAKGLGLVAGRVIKFSADKVQVPHIGWNDITFAKSHLSHPVFSKLKDHLDFYFVHSYYFSPQHESEILARANYGENFAAAVTQKNVVGVQFHPEKSQGNGLKLLEAFLDWNGAV